MDLIGDLELMQELAEQGSFSAVARLRGQNASSVARRLDRLEAHIGKRLFNRTPTGLFLTTTGAGKLAQARALTTAAATFTDRDNADGDLRGHIVIAAPSRLGEVCVAPIIARFLAENPGVSIEFHLSDAMQDLDRERIDLAVRIGEGAAEHHIIRRIAYNYRILVASRGYLERHPPIRHVEQINGCDGLLLGNASAWRLQDRLGKVFVATPKPRLRCLSGDILVSMCKADLGVALKSSWDVAEAVSAGHLVHLLPDWRQADPTNIMIVMPSRRLISRTSRAFSAALEEGLKTMPHRHWPDALAAG